MTTNYIKSYEFHGLSFVDAPGSHKRTTCPFCNADGHFYVYVGETVKDHNGTHADGMFHCKRCDKRGNVFTFLTRLIEESVNQTTEYTELWQKKRIPSYVTKLCNIGKSIITGDWLLPTCKINDKGKLTVTNIHKWWESKNKLFGTTGMNVNLLGLEFLSEKKLPIFIVEGHWDRVVIEHVFRKLNLRDQYDILSAPGAGGFKEEWLGHLFERDVFIVFDGDHEKTTPKGNKVQPGLNGMMRIVKMCDSLEEDIKPRIKYMNWPSGLADGYDVRDLFMDCLKKAKK